MTRSWSAMAAASWRARRKVSLTTSRLTSTSPRRSSAQRPGCWTSRQPIGLVLMGVMGHIDEDDAYPIVRQLLGGLPAGSFLALQDGAEMSEAFTEAQEDYDDTGAIPYHLRRPGADCRVLRGPGHRGSWSGPDPAVAPGTGPGRARRRWTRSAGSA